MKNKIDFIKKIKEKILEKKDKVEKPKYRIKIKLEKIEEGDK